VIEMGRINMDSSLRSISIGTLAMAAIAAASGGCRVGGPSEDTAPYVISMPDGAPANDGDAGGAVGSDGGGGDDGAVDPPDAKPDAPDPGDGGCSPTFTSTTCDPVCNTGCTGLDRCNIVDNATHEGKCIGSWISGEGEFCIKTSITDPCAQKLSCVDSKCARLCYHDSDCTKAGTACNKDVASTGYKMCGPL
jgi:hypothetical protein